ncbi:MAG TPA: carboxymuconolactone decarboxylase family protein [Acidimicrobiales bacterium]
MGQDPAVRSDELGELVRTSVGHVPEEIRDDWDRYLRRTIEDLWGRKTLAPGDRSLVTVAALTVMESRSELDGHIRLALHHGLSRLELCEAMLQVAGYAGVGRGVEGLRALAEVFDSEPDLGTDSADPPAGVEGDERLERARPIQALMSPEHVDAIFERLEPYPVDTAPDERPPFLAGGPEWLGWLTETAFGDLWSRPNLTLAQRELVTSSVLIVLGRNAELRGHFGVALRLGISPEEMSEAIVHLGAYAGFPTAVGAMLLFTEVLAEREGST